MSKSRHVSRAEKGIVNWVCWSVNKNFSFDRALELIKRADNGELWLKVVGDFAFFSIGTTPIGELHLKGVLAAGEWGPNGPEDGFDAFMEYWEDYVWEQNQIHVRNVMKLAAQVYPDGTPELVCPV